MAKCKITDLIEMWGYFMGREHAHRRYGPTRHSLSTSPNFINSWYAFNENKFGNSIFEGSGHIAAAFLHDIRDDNRYNRTNNLVDNPINIPDSIHGYTIQTIFNNMGSSTNTASQLVNSLRLQIPSGVGNNIINYDSLAAVYGY